MRGLHGFLADDAAAQRGEHTEPSPVGSASDHRDHAAALPVEELAEGGGEGGAVGQGVPVDRLGAVGRLVGEEVVVANLLSQPADGIGGADRDEDGGGHVTRRSRPVPAWSPQERHN